MRIHHEGWSVWEGPMKIPSPTYKNLYRAIQDPVTIDYWTKPHHNQATPRLTLAAVPLIDWKSSANFMEDLPFARKRWITKHASDNCGVSKTLMLWTYQDHDRCPRCGDPEDAAHVSHCHGHGADDIWTTSMEELVTLLEQLDTHPSLLHAIPQRLNQWRNQHPLPPLQGDDSFMAALAEQDTIGWKNFADGFVTKLWIPIQTAHYRRIRSRKHGVSWMTKVLRKSHELVWRQWDHRNDILHRVDQPRQKAARALLDACCVREVTIGCHNYPVRDRKQFSIPLFHLLDRSTGFKKNWILNVTAIRQKLLRRTTNDPEAIYMPPETAAVIKWMKTPRLR